jgi:nitrogen-specific signal transduction histidine kinase
MTLIVPVIPHQKETTVMENDAAQVVRHLAHELRQPLSALESLAFYLQMTLPAADERSQVQVSKMRQLIQQASSLIDDAVHTVQAAPAHPACVAMDELLRRAFESTAERPVAVRIAIPPECCRVWLDRAQAEHLAATIARFFRSAVPLGTLVEIKGHRFGAQTTIEFEAPSELVSHALLAESLEPFNVRASASGLTLASAARIAAAHDGSLTHAMLPDHRFALHLRLPAASQESPQE